MATKRRKRKPKPTRESKPKEQVIVLPETEEPARPIEIELEIEDSASPAEFRDQSGASASPVTPSPDAEEPVSDSAPAPTGADRRSHPRYAFTAAAEVIAAERSAEIRTRVRDLSQQGCYVDTDSPLPLGTATDVLITKGATSFAARARVVYNQPGKGMGLMFTAVEFEHVQTLNMWIAESRESSWLAANRRRSQRVLMNIPVRISGQAAGPSSLFEEETYTLAISAHGALIIATSPVYRGQRFTLSNERTKASLECVVVHVDRSPRGQIKVGVEFLLPNSRFWGVAFPPTDWTPRHPDAKFGQS
jgi:PilZ domain-containing protein